MDSEIDSDGRAVCRREGKEWLRATAADEAKG